MKKFLSVAAALLLLFAGATYAQNSNIPNGGGGSGGGGGGGAVTIADGADTAQGTRADAVCGTATGTCTLIALLKFLNNAVTGPIAAGTNIIGKTGIDQTTPGTTNGVQATNFPATVDTNSGNKSASTPRFVLATDQPNLTTPFNVRNGYGAAQLTHVAISISSSGNNTIVTRSVGTIKVYGLELSCASALTTITPQDGTSTNVGAKTNVSSVFEPISSEPYYTTTGTNNFVINLSSAVTCTGWAKVLDN